MSQYAVEMGARGPTILPGVAWTPSGAKTIYIHHNAGAAFSDLPDEVSRNLTTSWARALAQVEDDRGDIIQCLPGHAESISAASYLTSVDSTMPRGWTLLGPPTGKPAIFTWTVAGSTAVLSAADCGIDGNRMGNDFGIIFQMEPTTGSVNVAAPLTLSGSRSFCRRTRMFAGTDANNKVTVGVTITGSNVDFSGNRLTAATAAEATTFVRLTQADYLTMYNTRIIGATTSASVGVLQFLTTASTFVDLKGCVYKNNKSGGGAGDQAVTGMAGISGEMDHCLLSVLGNNAGNLTGAFGTPANMQFGRQNWIVNTIAERGALFGTESA